MAGVVVSCFAILSGVLRNLLYFVSVHQQSIFLFFLFYFAIPTRVTPEDIAFRCLRLSTRTVEDYVVASSTLDHLDFLAPFSWMFEY